MRLGFLIWRRLILLISEWCTCEVGNLLPTTGYFWQMCRRSFQIGFLNKIMMRKRYLIAFNHILWPKCFFFIIYATFNTMYWDKNIQKFFNRHTFISTIGLRNITLNSLNYPTIWYGNFLCLSIIRLFMICIQTFCESNIKYHI